MINLTWSNLSQFTNLKKEFKTNANANLQDLNNDSKTDSVSHTLVYKLIKVLCSKNIQLDEKIQTEFFKKISHILAPAEKSSGIFSSLTQLFTKETNQNDILLNLCSKAIKSNKPTLATHIVHLISEYAFGEEVESKEVKSLPNLALLALKKGKEFASLVQLLIEKLPPEAVCNYINQINEDGESLLILATKHKLTKLMEFLINHGANPDIAAKNKETALSIAMQNGLPLPHLQNLIFHMQDFSFVDEDQNNYLHRAFQNGLPQMVSILSQVDVNTINSDGFTPLHLALNLDDQKAAVQLMKHKPNADTRAACLPIAIDKKFEEIAISLISPFFRMSPDGEMDCFVKALNNNLNKFALLFFSQIHEAEIASGGTPPFSYFNEFCLNACKSNSYDVISSLLKKYGVTIFLINKVDVLLQAMTRFDENNFSSLLTIILSHFSIEHMEKPQMELFTLFTKVLNSFSGLDKYKKIILTAIIDHPRLVGAHDYGYLCYTLLDQAVTSQCDLIIAHLLGKGVKDEKNIFLRQAISLKNKAMTELFLSNLSETEHLSDTFSEVIGQSTPNEFTASTPPDKDQFDLLLWIFNNFLTEMRWSKYVHLEYTIKVFKGLLYSAFSHNLEIDGMFFTNALKISKLKQFLGSFLKTIINELNGTDGPHGRDSVEASLIYLLGKMRNIYECLDAELIKEIIQYFEKQAKLKEKEITEITQKEPIKVQPLKEKQLFQAKQLGAIFSNETLDLQFSDGNTLKVNPFILLGIPALRAHIQGQFYDQSTRVLPLEIPFSYFKIIYDYLDKKVLDYSDLQGDEKSIQELDSYFKFYEIRSPVDLERKKTLTHQQIIEEFLAYPYESNETELLIDKSTFSVSAVSLVTFLTKHPNITKIKCNSDLFEIPALRWQVFTNILKLQEVHLHFKELHKELTIPAGIDHHCLFYLSGLKNMQSKFLIDFIKNCKIGGLDFSGRTQFDFSIDKDSLKTVKYLNFSNASIDTPKLIEFLGAVPNLTELHLENCQCLTDQDLASLIEACPNLETINLQGNQNFTAYGITNFIINCPKLTTCYLPKNIPNLNFEEILVKSKNPLILYFQKKRIVSKEEFPSRTDLEQMIGFVMADDLYIQEDNIIVTLKLLLEKVKPNQTLSPNEQQALIQLLTKVKNSEKQHPLIQATRGFNDNQLIIFYLTLIKNLEDHCLAEYLREADLESLYNTFRRLAEQNKLTLDQARELSKHFPETIAPLIPISVKKPKTDIRPKTEPKQASVTFLFRPLILICAGESLKKSGESGKTSSLSEFVLKYIHVFLEKGEVNLKKINSNGLLAICSKLREYGLSVESFLGNALDKEVNVKFSRSITPKNIQTFLNNPEIKNYVKMIDLTKSPEIDTCDLVKNLEKLEKIRFSASNQQIQDNVWELLISKGIEVTLVSNDPEQLKKFQFPRNDLFKGSACRIQVELEEVDGPEETTRFGSLPEYLDFAEKVPALNNIDLSKYILCKGSDELKRLINICDKVHPKKLDLGNCETLDEADFTDIANRCQGLIELKASHANPVLIQKTFFRHRLDACEIKNIDTQVTNEFSKVDLRGFGNEIDVQDVIDSCKQVNPMFLHLGTASFTEKDINKIAKVCPTLIAIACENKYLFNILNIFKKYSPDVEFTKEM